MGIVDVSVHPRFREDGSVGPINDTFRSIAEEAAILRPDAPYCQGCGEPVSVPSRRS